MVYAAGFLFYLYFCPVEKRIRELDALRVIAMFFVITYHFGMLYAERGIPHFNFLCLTPNYEFGNVAVTIFFILSGGLLYKKYETLQSLSINDFYLKRAKSIYPAFWLLSLYIPVSIVLRWFSGRDPFVYGHPAKLLLTLVGMDGYAQSFGVSTYFFGGEWFVGAIVILYLLYPFLAKCYKAKPVLLMTLLIIGYGTQFPALTEARLEWLNVLPLTVALKFTLGFFIFEHLEFLKRKIVVLPSFVLFILLTAIDVPGILKTDFLGFLAALFFFVLAYWSSPWLFRFNLADSAVNKLAALSYCVFLVQHVAISWSQMVYARIFSKMQWEFSQWNVLALFLVTFIVIILAAKCLKWMSDKLVHLILG